MLSQSAKDLFAKLGMENPAVAVKLCFSKPEGAEPVGKSLSFCQFVREAQDSGRTFYTTKEDDNCLGKMVLGMEPKSGFGCSGQAGFDFGVYRTPAANARLYSEIPTLVPGAHNYVLFAPVATCNFDPDLVICIANTSQADILMRATSYISGDLWESKTSCVLSCAWTYAYPYQSGKVNFCITGMHHGMRRRKVYPMGLHIIAIPYQKLDEVVTALGQMDWNLLAMREDDEGKAMLREKMDGWERMTSDFKLVRN